MRPVSCTVTDSRKNPIWKWNCIKLCGSTSILWVCDGPWGKRGLADEIEAIDDIEVLRELMIYSSYDFMAIYSKNLKTLQINSV